MTLKRRTRSGAARDEHIRWYGVGFVNGHPCSVRDIIGHCIANGPTGLSQRYIARRAGISEKHLSQIMQGAVRMSARVAVQLEDPLGVPALALMLAQAVADIATVRAELGQTGDSELESLT